MSKNIFIDDSNFYTDSFEEAKKSENILSVTTKPLSADELIKTINDKITPQFDTLAMNPPYSLGVDYGSVIGDTMAMVYGMAGSGKSSGMLKVLANYLKPSFTTPVTTTEGDLDASKVWNDDASWEFISASYKSKVPLKVYFKHSSCEAGLHGVIEQPRSRYPSYPPHYKSVTVRCPNCLSALTYPDAMLTYAHLTPTTVEPK